MSPKQLAVLIIVFVICRVSLATELQPAVHIRSVAQGGDFAPLLADRLEALLLRGLRRDFPCTAVSTDSVIAAALNHEREKALLGVGDDSAVQEAGAVLCLTEYLVLVEVTDNRTLGRVILSLVLLDLKRGGAPVRRALTTMPDEAALDSCESIIRDFLSDVAYLELCPYRGRVQVSVNTTRDERHETQTPVFCNGSVQTRKDISTQTAEQNQFWDLQKIRRRAAVGGMKYTSQERFYDRVEDGCHPCSTSMRQGGRIWTKERTVKISIDGLSEKSATTEDAAMDARIQLRFEKDGTYYVAVRAASKEGPMVERTLEKAEGTCDSINEPPQERQVKASIPIWGGDQGQEFGPFRGTPFDKALSDKLKMTMTSDMPKETTVVEIEFNLSRR